MGCNVVDPYAMIPPTDRCALPPKLWPGCRRDHPGFTHSFVYWIADAGACGSEIIFLEPQNRARETVERLAARHTTAIFSRNILCRQDCTPLAAYVNWKQLGTACS
jgi:hypothetical protein